MKYPLKIEDLHEYIYMNTKGQIVIDSRVKGWDEIIPFCEDNIVDTSNYHDEGTPEYSEDIDWSGVIADFNSFNTAQPKTKQGGDDGSNT